MSLRRLVALAWVPVIVLGTATAAAAQHSHGHDGHDKPPEAHQHGTQPPPGGTRAHDEHEGHSAGTELPPFIPRLTDEDRRAAFPDVQGHAVHDQAIHSFVLMDQLEWQTAGGFGLEAKGWIGRASERFWFRASGAADEGEVEGAEVQLFYGRQLARWWDVVVGLRQDFEPGPAQTWAAIGIQGLAPYWFEVEATAYVGAGGRTELRFDTEYELLLTNRLVAQPHAGIEIHGKADPERGKGSGLGSVDLGLRLRYEVRREFAPYVGVAWERSFLGTADLAEAAGGPVSRARLVAGARVWF